MSKKIEYKNKGIIHVSFKEYLLKDRTIIGLFQGSRGENPDLDFIVKQKEPGKKVRIPTHTHWVVDLIIKMEYDKNSVRDFINFFINKYDKIEPFISVQQRNNYKRRFVSKSISYLENVKDKGQYSPEYLATIIELFIKCEKQTTNAFMFKKLLELISKYCFGQIDFYRLIGHSKRV